MHTDHEIHHGRPDITGQEKNNNDVLIIEIAVPGDGITESKERG